MADDRQGSDGYKRIKRIGSGGFAEVWHAEAPGGVDVAVKIVFHPIERDEAQRELQSLETIKRLRHPFLLQTHQFSIINGKLNVVMELADGSLRDRLKECRAASKKGIPPVELAPYFREAAEALDFLHEQHVLHRDIKPENILLLQHHAKVADFGLARVLQSQMASATGAGTPRYMAPESWRGKISTHSDQYSLALTYAELRLDRWPFPGTDMASIMLDHLTKDPDLSELPEAEKKVLLKALAKEPQDRYGTCTEFVQALLETLDIKPLPGPTPSKPAAVETRVMTPAPTPQTPADPFVTVQRAAVAPSKADPFVTVQPGRASQEKTDQIDKDGRPIALPSSLKDTEVGWRSETPRRRSRVPIMFVGLIVLAAFGAGGWYFLSPLLGRSRVPFALQPPAPLTIRAGERKSLTLQFNSAAPNASAEVELGWAAPGLQVKWKPEGEGLTRVAVEVEAFPEASPGMAKITIHATSGSQTADGELEVKIEPLPYYLPPRWAKAAGAKPAEINGITYYDRIDVLADGERAPFLLIPANESPRIEPLYIMEDKVWAGLFRKFAASQTLKDAGWQTIKSNEIEKNPVMGVHVADAYEFCRWLAGPRSQLPTSVQWDKAAGRYEKNRGQGPYLEPSDAAGIAIGRKEPKPVGTSSQDRSLFGCRDMAGNGLEWTRDLAGGGERRTVPVKEPRSLDQVILRGRDFIKREPLRFEFLEDDLSPEKSSEFYLQPGPHDGFRAMFEP